MTKTADSAAGGALPAASTADDLTNRALRRFDCLYADWLKARASLAAIAKEVDGEPPDADGRSVDERIAELLDLADDLAQRILARPVPAPDRFSDKMLVLRAHLEGGTEWRDQRLTLALASLEADFMHWTEADR